MAIVLDKKTPVSEIKKLLEKTKNKRKLVNMKLFSGKINWRVNGVAYQRKLRNADR